MIADDRPAAMDMSVMKMVPYPESVSGFDLYGWSIVGVRGGGGMDSDTAGLELCDMPGSYYAN